MSKEDIDFKNDFKEDFKEDNYFDDYNFERKPQLDSYDTFRLRTDPTDLLKQLELQLRNETEEKNKEGKTFRKKIVGTTPLCNEQGIQQILHRAKTIINNHAVQGNQKTLEEHRLRVREMADSLTIMIFANYTAWDLDIKQTNSIVDEIYFLIDMFLTRTIDNKERELYGETYKENTSRELKQEKTRGGFINNTLSKMLAR